MGSSSPQTPSASVAEGPLQPGPETKEDTAIWSLRHIQILWSWAARPKPSKPAYPPISSIAYTSAARLTAPDASPKDFPSEPILAKAAAHHGSSTPSTVLYLAYGSNMCAKTFLGMRGIRPISQLNVSAPSLDLTFDLPGLPYREPCFANTALRKIPDKPPKLPPKLPPVPEPPLPPSPAPAPLPPSTTASGAPRWNKGLYGVVYEVTSEDYAKILATEGGGASYHDILVPCIPLPPPVSVPERPSLPIPKPFLARTLYAPRLPDVPDHPPTGGDDRPDGPDKDPKKPEPPSWLKKLFLPVRRPSPDYAQPSARYLGLLIAGAREHELPLDYQTYLERLQAFTITTCRQKVGQVLFLGFWIPSFMVLMMGSRLMSDKQGRAPSWMVAATTVLFNIVWKSYDCLAKPLFGDGERTMEEEESVRTPTRTLWGRWVRMGEMASDEEKRGLLSPA